MKRIPELPDGVEALLALVGAWAAPLRPQSNRWIVELSCGGAVRVYSMAAGATFDQWRCAVLRWRRAAAARARLVRLVSSALTAAGAMGEESASPPATASQQLEPESQRQNPHSASKPTSHYTHTSEWDIPCWANDFPSYWPSPVSSKTSSRPVVLRFELHSKLTAPSSVT